MAWVLGLKEAECVEIDGCGMRFDLCKFAVAIDCVLNRGAFLGYAQFVAEPGS